MVKNVVATLVLVLWAVMGGVDGHGYLSSPAARNSAWRFGFPTPANYNDNELFCGGREVQHGRNGGKCGVCGDNWSLPQPRPHERGGRYGRGVITANYTEGQVMPVTVHITANHMGWYEFRLCQNNNPSRSDSQRCLDKHLLPLADGSGVRYPLKRGVLGSQTLHLQLPRGVSCTHCVLQWSWVVGNTWGMCPDGSSGLGCGAQETFVNCADISVLPKHYKPRKPSNKPKFWLGKRW